MGLKLLTALTKNVDKREYMLTLFFDDCQWLQKKNPHCLKKKINIVILNFEKTILEK